MLVIRLTRIGKRNQPAYRVVLAEKSEAVKGKFQEILGNYNPRLKTKTFKAERIQYWLRRGAQASPTVHNLLVSEKIINAAKVKAWRPKKKTQGKEVKPAETGEQPKEAKAEAPAEAAPVETPVAAPEEETKIEEPKAEEKAVE